MRLSAPPDPALTTPLIIARESHLCKVECKCCGIKEVSIATSGIHPQMIKHWSHDTREYKCNQNDKLRTQICNKNKK